MGHTAKASVSSSQPITTMTAKYELMENYQLGGPFAVGTEISTLRVPSGWGGYDDWRRPVVHLACVSRSIELWRSMARS